MGSAHRPKAVFIVEEPGKLRSRFKTASPCVTWTRRKSWPSPSTSTSRKSPRQRSGARLLDRVVTDLAPTDIDRYLVRDAQRVIEAIEALVRIHNAQEEDIYEHATA